jgi:hypothetical protein
VWLGRSYSRPLLDLFLFPQKTVDFGLQGLNAFGTIQGATKRYAVADKLLQPNTDLDRTQLAGTAGGKI